MPRRALDEGLVQGAEPGSRSDDGLRLLASWGGETADAIRA